MKTLATSYAHQNWPQFCAHKGGMEIIGIELFQELTIGMQHFNDSTKLDCRPEALKIVPCTVVSDFKEILSECKYADGDFLFPNPDVAEHIKFHRCIVAAHSKPLFQLITSNNKTKQYIIDGLSYASIKDLLEYIYFGDIKFDPVGACKTIELAINQFALKHLLQHCIHSISNGIKDEYAIDILRVTYLPEFQTPEMNDLRQNVLQHICKHFKAIQITTIRSVKPKEIAYEMLADVLEIVYQNFPEGAAILLPPKKVAKPKKERKHRRVSRTLSSSVCGEEKKERVKTKRTISISKM